MSPSTLATRESRQGGDLTGFQDRQIILDLSICTKRLGPPDSAVRALLELASTRRRSTAS